MDCFIPPAAVHPPARPVTIDADLLPRRPPGARAAPRRRRRGRGRRGSRRRGKGEPLNPRASSVLTGTGLAVGGAVLPAGMFVAFVAPSWPRTVWGWLLSAALGLPLLLLVQ